METESARTAKLNHRRILFVKYPVKYYPKYNIKCALCNKGKNPVFKVKAVN